MAGNIRIKRDDEPITVKLCEIEFQARAGTNTSHHTMWLVEHLRIALAENQSLLVGIAKSAEQLGNALDTIDVPDTLVDDIMDDFAYDETEDFR